MDLQIYLLKDLDHQLELFIGVIVIKLGLMWYQNLTNLLNCYVKLWLQQWQYFSYRDSTSLPYFLLYSSFPSSFSFSYLHLNYLHSYLYHFHRFQQIEHLPFPSFWFQFNSIPFQLVKVRYLNLDLMKFNQLKFSDQLKQTHSVAIKLEPVVEHLLNPKLSLHYLFVVLHQMVFLLEFGKVDCFKEVQYLLLTCQEFNKA